MSDIQICLTRLSKIAKETGKIIDVVVTPDDKFDVATWTAGDFSATFRSKTEIPIEDVEEEFFLC